ncbi:MAG: hypothetical protein KAI66_16505 [Lentisphaeria bacterium]|nr:hypothetical protein [Lentisphaeria bacterium]
MSNRLFIGDMMMKYSSRIAAALLAIALAMPTLLTGQDAPRPQKKLIATGWDKVDSARLVRNIREMETRPFGGVFMAMSGTREDGRTCQLRNVQTRDPWKREWFAKQLQELRGVELRTFTDNFLSIGANPGNVDWFDDEGWENVVEHWAIAAWLAKQGRFRGLLFDPEPYHKPYAQFRHSAQEQAAAHTFEQYAAKARERGRQVMSAMAREFPDLTLFCYFMNSANAAAARAKKPQHVLRGGHYGLYPAFIDGWLDAAPATITFVDGCESAYRYSSRLQYLASSVAIKGICQRLVASENRAKYRAQVQVSFGIYLDAYWNPENTKWERWRVDCGDAAPVEKLLDNVSAALESCDEYVWIYGEKFRWWPTPNQRVFPQSWSEALPNCDLALLCATDPDAMARRVLRNAEENNQPLPNLTKNGAFGDGSVAKDVKQAADDWVKAGAPAGWTTWQTTDDKGVFAHDRKLGAAKATGVVRGGCFIQTIEGVAPGEVYAITARTKTTGGSTTSIRIRWQTPEGKWTREGQDVFILPEAPGTEGWHRLFGTVLIPDSAGRLVILLSISGQTGTTDTAWFDDVQAFRIADRDLFSATPVRCDLEQTGE